MASTLRWEKKINDLRLYKSKECLINLIKPFLCHVSIARANKWEESPQYCTLARNKNEELSCCNASPVRSAVINFNPQTSCRQPGFILVAMNKNARPDGCRLLRYSRVLESEIALTNCWWNIYKKEKKKNPHGKISLIWMQVSKLIIALSLSLCGLRGFVMNI